ncbi:helix-turn-helix domain-containing protein [Modestobacter sp. KNN46-3]|uniref:helix-turn-helix domain-containing protein n=1 Tax=Modestobacter sp. KNN46-3 TaxID=2711218 RepID=UPI0013DFECB9|nr:helix-turn-helix domain-containing protein [Modestobacter sp. KNN46-3]
MTSASRTPEGPSFISAVPTAAPCAQPWWNHCPDQVEWLSSDAAAAYLFTPEVTLRTWRARLIGPPFHRVGHRVMYSRRDLDVFVAAGRVQTSGVVSLSGPELAAVLPSDDQ